MAGEQYDAPNQQVVRPDGSAPWEEGKGGATGSEPKKTSRKRATPPAETQAQPDPVPEEPTTAG